MDDSVVKKTIKRYTKCRMCGGPIPETSPYRNQGYCDCAFGATREGGLKNLSELMPTSKSDDKPVDEPKGIGKSETVSRTHNPNKENAFTLYVKDVNEKLQLENGTPLTDDQLSEQWKQLTKDEKKKYFIKASGKVSTLKEPVDISTVKCYKCNYMGHYAQDCKTKMCDFCGGRRHDTR